MSEVSNSTSLRWNPTLFVFLAISIFLYGAFCGWVYARLCAHKQDYSMELIAPGAGTFVLSQKTGRIYAVEAFGQAEYVADISEWDKDDTLRPGTELRAHREAVAATPGAWIAPDVPPQNASPGK